MDFIFNSSIGVDTSEFMKNNQYTASFLLGLPFVLLFKYSINEREGRAIALKDIEERLIPAKDWKTHLMVIAQWLFATLVLGFILFIFFQEF